MWNAIREEGIGNLPGVVWMLGYVNATTKRGRSPFVGSPARHCSSVVICFWHIAKGITPRELGVWIGRRRRSYRRRLHGLLGGLYYVAARTLWAVAFEPGVRIQ